MRFDIDKIQFPSVSLHNNYYSLFVFRDTTQNKVDLVKKSLLSGSLPVNIRENPGPSKHNAGRWPINTGPSVKDTHTCKCTPPAIGP